MKIEEIRRNFIMDPSEDKAKHLISMVNRLNLKIPLSFEEIRSFCVGNKEAIMSYISAVASMKLGEDSNLAYNAVFRVGADREWAEKIIERDVHNDPAHYGYFMYLNYGSDLEWTKKVIENAVSGDPSEWAYELFLSNRVDILWAMSVIEKSISGDPSYFANLMASYEEDGVSWAIRVVEKDKTGDQAYAAYFLVGKGADVNWAKRIMEESNRPYDARVLDWMFEMNYVDEVWLARVKGKQREIHRMISEQENDKSIVKKNPENQDEISRCRREYIETGDLKDLYKWQIQLGRSGFLCPHNQDVFGWDENGLKIACIQCDGDAEKRLVKNYLIENPTSRVRSIIKYLTNSANSKRKVCILCGELGPTWSGMYRKTVRASKWESDHREKHIKEEMIQDFLKKHL